MVDRTFLLIMCVNIAFLFFLFYETFNTGSDKVKINKKETRKVEEKIEENIEKLMKQERDNYFKENSFYIEKDGQNYKITVEYLGYSFKDLKEFKELEDNKTEVEEIN